ncbi:MAG TPA: DNA-3-methyladenine glycosylase I, partial [Woeseiaceae bacterium]|nr:DNA-3-methyladenine glycosylase I [Woeseiaceae bacterium]
KNPAIVRNRLKVESAVGNAKAFLAVQEEFGSFSDYIWGFVDGKPIRNRWRRNGDVPATSPESDALSKDLKQRGFRFVGSTIIYAHMQATGMVNDHLVTCFRYDQCR